MNYKVNVVVVIHRNLQYKSIKGLPYTVSNCCDK